MPRCLKQKSRHKVHSSTLCRDYVLRGRPGSHHRIPLAELFHVSPKFLFHPVRYTRPLFYVVEFRRIPSNKSRSTIIVYAHISFLSCTFERMRVDAFVTKTRWLKERCFAALRTNIWLVRHGKKICLFCYGGVHGRNGECFCDFSLLVVHRSNLWTVFSDFVFHFIKRRKHKTENNTVGYD